MPDGKRGLRSIGEGLILLIVSWMMFNLELFSILYIAPLLLYAVNHGVRKGTALVLVDLAAIIISDIFLIDGSVTTKLGFAFLLIDLYIPLSLSAAGIIWLRTRGERRLLRRLFLVLLPSIVLLVPYAAFILSDRALSAGIYSAYGNVFAAIMGPLLGLVAPSVDIKAFTDLILITVMSLLFPVLLCGICASCFIYETALHSRESGWEGTVMGFSFPQDAIWGFIASWALVLILRFVSAPLLLEIAVLNIASVWTVLYAIQGFTVVFARVRRRHGSMRSMTLLVIMLVLGLLVPGINFLILIGVPLLGVLENFFDLKKIGVENEDHS